MEYSHFLSHITKYLPNNPLQSHKNFMAYLDSDQGKRKFEELADFLMVVIPDSPEINRV